MSLRKIIQEEIEEIIISEVGEGNIESYEWHKLPDKDYSVDYSFETPSGLIYYLSMIREEQNTWDGGFSAADIETDRFIRNDGTTDRGEMYRVMATLVEIIKAFVDDFNPKKLIFEPAKAGEDDNRRKNLYSAYIRKHTPEGYTIGEEGDKLTITRDAMEYFEEGENINGVNKKEILKQYISLLQAGEDSPYKDLAIAYFRIIYNALVLEEQFGKEMALAGKTVNDKLDVESLQSVPEVEQKFLELYDVYHPVRNAVETLDSIEEIRLWMQNNPDFYDKFLKEDYTTYLGSGIPKKPLEETEKQGNVYKVYHGTDADFEDFDLEKATQGIIWFTDSINSIENGEHGGMGNKYIMTRYITLRNPAGWSEYDKLGLGQIEDRGHDGVILPHGTEYNDYIVFNTESISKMPPGE